MENKNQLKTLKEVRKFSWMAGKGYGNAKAMMLALRDTDGYAVVYNQDDDLKELLYIRPDGTVMEGALQYLQSVEADDHPELFARVIKRYSLEKQLDDTWLKEHISIQKLVN